VHFNLLIAFFFRSAALLLGYLLLAPSKTLAQLLVLEEGSLNILYIFSARHGICKILNLTSFQTRLIISARGEGVRLNKKICR